MQQARDRLDAFRSRRKPVPPPPSPSPPVNAAASPRSNVPHTDSLLDRVLNFDLLGTAPFEFYYRNLDQRLLPTVLITFAAMGIGFIGAISCGFGSVFAIFSLILFILLSLGTKKEGEACCTMYTIVVSQVSAYSVFNDGCRRLLGQMSAEHFERDLLRRRTD